MSDPAYDEKVEYTLSRNDKFSRTMERERSTINGSIALKKYEHVGGKKELRINIYDSSFIDFLRKVESEKEKMKVDVYNSWNKHILEKYADEISQCDVIQICVKDKK